MHSGTRRVLEDSHGNTRLAVVSVMIGRTRALYLPRYRGRATDERGREVIRSSGHAVMVSRVRHALLAVNWGEK